MKNGFTLVELVIAVALFMMAAGVALSATVGANSLIQKAETRSLLVEGSRNTENVLRQGLSLTRMSDVALSSSDGTIEIKQFLSQVSQKTCIKVGLADQSYNFSLEGPILVAKVYIIDAADNCGGSPIYQGRLTDPKVKVTRFDRSLVNEGNNFGLLRYRLALIENESRQVESKRASIEVTTSLAVGLGQ